jgi:integrase
MSDNIRKVCGCPPRGWAKCPHPWHFHFKWNGIHHRFSLDRHLGRQIDSKTLAETEAEKLRIAIKEGKFGSEAPQVEGLTLRQLADTYVERYVEIDRASTAASFKYELNTICRTKVPRVSGGPLAFGDWPLADIVTDTIERFRETRIAEGAGRVGVNRGVRRLRALFRWAIKKGYAKQTPFKLNGETVISLDQDNVRSRRLNPPEWPSEEEKLLAACGSHLKAIVIAAIESGMRRGELLSLQWSQIEGMTIEKNGNVTWASTARVFLPKEKTKTKKDRWVPISTRLKGILEMRRFDPAGEVLPIGAFVFGTEIGERVTAFKRAWNTALLKSHGFEPAYVEGANLSAASRAALKTIDLHFHDLRREAGSRWLEGGVPLHTVRDWLGHTDISQTSTYLAGTRADDHSVMARFEERQAALQHLATEAKTEGRKRPRPASARPQKTRKSAVGRSSVTM